MTTSWTTPEVAEGFEAYDDTLEEVLGYRFVFEALRAAPGVREPVVLDYGCGPGKVALRYVSSGPGRVVAVDLSAAMLSIAQQKRSHPSIDYRLVDGDTLDTIEPGTIDAAMACYVFINTASEARIRRIVSAVHGVLRPGGSFVVLDTNPDTTGVGFSSFRSGEAGRRYRPGESRVVELWCPGGGVLTLHDFHWPKETYLRALSDAGFGRVDVAEATLRDVGADAVPECLGSPLDPRAGEWHHPPFVVFTAYRD